MTLELEEILEKLTPVDPNCWMRYSNGFSTWVPSVPTFNLCLYRKRDKTILRVQSIAHLHGWEFYAHFTGAKVNRLYKTVKKKYSANRSPEFLPRPA